MRLASESGAVPFSARSKVGVPATPTEPLAVKARPAPESEPSTVTRLSAKAPRAAMSSGPTPASRVCVIEKP